MSKRQAQWLVGGVLVVLAIIASKFKRNPAVGGPSPFYADLNTVYEDLSAGRVAHAEQILLQWDAPEVSLQSLEFLKWLAAMLWFNGLPDESANLSRLIGQTIQSARVEAAERNLASGTERGK